MNVRPFVPLMSACTVLATAISFCPVARAQSLFVGNYNDGDNQPFDGQHPVQQYNATTGAYQTNLAFPGRPTGLTTAPDGSLYAANFTDFAPGSTGRPSDTIERYDNATGNFVQVADLGVADPYGIKVDAQGNIYVAALYYNVDGRSQGEVLKYDATSKTVAPVAQVDNPYDVAFDANGGLYVTANHYPDAHGSAYGAVLKLNEAKTAFEFFAAVPAPTGIVFRDGKLYVGSFNTGFVYQFGTDGSYVGAANVGGHPDGLAFDADGVLFAATYDGEVRRYDAGANIFQAFAGNGGHPLIHPFGLAFANIGNHGVDAAPEPPGVAALAFTGLMLGGGLLSARRRASRSADGPDGETHG